MTTASARSEKCVSGSLQFSNSVLQIPRVAEAFDVTYHTARRDVEKLVKLEILSETELGGVRTFLAPEILGITYD